ncbi:MAG TPA: septal ring lytic transglycosylase RlpA family protein [Steroidobacteraceae bacterium]|nr:septal ring lytic transglycosylase RlpA family protein [Steroidobacteraceae bacterium]
MAVPRVAALVAASAGSLLLAACASAPRRAARAPAAPDRVATPDAVPRAEPRSSHGNPPYYDVNGRRYQVLASADGYTERGVASWYGPDFQGHNTSSGEPYDMYGMSAAHRTLPLPCYARVTNLSNGRSVIVRVNDRGPFVANRIVDLSYTAALRLDIVRTGTAFVELRTVQPGEMPTPAAAPPAAPPPAVPVPAVPVPAVPEPTAPEPMAPVPAAAPAMPVAESAPAMAPLEAPTAPPLVALYIQVGAFAEPGNAQRLVKRLRAAGIQQVFTLNSAATGQRLRRVRIGPIASVEDFDRLAARLASLGYPEARLAND